MNKERLFFVIVVVVVLVLGGVYAFYIRPSDKAAEASALETGAVESADSTPKANTPASAKTVRRPTGSAMTRAEMREASKERRAARKAAQEEEKEQEENIENENRPGDPFQDFLAGKFDEDDKTLREQKEEILDGVYEFLDQYEEMSPEDKIKTRLGLNFMQSFLEGFEKEAGNIVAGWPEESRQKAIEDYDDDCAVIQEIQDEFNETLSAEEWELVRGPLESFVRLTQAFYEAATK